MLLLSPLLSLSLSLLLLLSLSSSSSISSTSSSSSYPSSSSPSPLSSSSSSSPSSSSSISICQEINSNHNIKSSLLKSSQDIDLTFENKGEEIIDIYWIDYEGNEVYMDSIEPQQSSLFSSFIGNAWRVKLQPNEKILFENILNENQKSILYQVGFGCKKIGFEFNTTEYIFKTESNIQMISNPQLVEDAIKKSPCFSLGLSDWINKHVVAVGYHVLCLSKSSSKSKKDDKPNDSNNENWNIYIEAWKDGYHSINQESGQTFVISSFQSLRKHVENLIQISTIHSDEYLQTTRNKIIQRMSKGSTHGQNSWEYLPQPWAMFKTDRSRILSLKDIDILNQNKSKSYFSSFSSLFSSLKYQDSMIALIMEGGQFVYPGIDLGFTRVLKAYDHDIKIVTLSMRPLVLKIEDFLTSHEIKYIIDSSAPHMRASPVSLMDKDKGKQATEFRTSEQVFLIDDSIILKNLELRVSNLTGCPSYHQERLQVLKYEINQYYLPHLDYWDPVYYQSPEEVKRSQAGYKNRLSTVFWYLSDCEGGYTAFPLAPVDKQYVSQILPEDNIDSKSRLMKSNGTIDNHLTHTMECNYGLRISPKVGSAILFYSLLPNGMGDLYSQHAACAVKNGTKWAANKWVWNQRL